MNYNLITEKFISVIFTDGRSGVLSLKDVLENASKISRLTYEYSVKAEMYSLYRFLVQLVTDIYRPANEEDIYDIYESGQFDTEKIGGYFDTYRDRFDLFDSKHPFMQATKEDYKDFEKARNDMNIMSPILRQGNNDIFYNPVKQFKNETSWTPQHAIYNLIFNTANHVRTGNGYKAPIMGGSGTTPLFVLYEGENLFQTIIINMNFVTDNDIPYWRRNKYGEVYAPFSVMNYEFYPVMKFKLDEGSFEDGVFKTVYMETDNKHAIFNLSDNELKEVKTSLMMSHPGIIQRNMKKDNTTVPEKADTQKEPWFSMGVLLQSRAKDKISQRTALMVMEEEGTMPEMIYVSFYGVHKGQNGPFKNLYENRRAIPEHAIFSKEKQAEIDSYIELIEYAGAILNIAAINYANEVIKIAPVSNAPRQYSEVKFVFFRNAKNLFFIEYLPDQDADINEYVDKAIKLCMKTFKELPAIHNDEINKRKQERFLLNKLKKKQEELYGSSEDKAK